MPKKTLQDKLDELFDGLELPSDKDIQLETASVLRSKANTLHKKGKKDSIDVRLKKSKSQTGRIKPEHAEKLRGRKRPKFAKKMQGKQVGEFNGNSKTYIVTEPNGKQYKITGLKSFAEKLNKPVVSAREMSKGKYPNNTCIKGAWAGWTIKPK